jgi:iron complex transport system substrate-binding protein
MIRTMGAIFAALLIGLAAACGTGSKEDPTPVAPTATPIPPTPEIVREAAPVLPATVVDINGTEVTITDVSRIIPLNGEVAEIVWALGLGENVVGTDTSATYPPEAVALQSIGYQRTLSAEGIISLNPSVIIGTETAGPPEVIEQIRSIGVPVVIVKDPVTLDDIGPKIRAVAEALGVPVRGDELATTTESEIEEARALAATATSQPRVMFLYVRGAQVQVIMGAGSGGDEMTTEAGAIDVGVELGIQGTKPITPESLVAGAPDAFLLLTAGLESVGGVDGLLEIPGIAETPAGENRNVIALDDQYLLGFGPRAGQALMELIKALHPELA